MAKKLFTQRVAQLAILGKRTALFLSTNAPVSVETVCRAAMDYERAPGEKTAARHMQAIDNCTAVASRLVTKESRPC